MQNVFMKGQAEYYKKEIEESRLDLEQNKTEDNCIKVKCGEAIGYLHLKLFICPGIHEKCVEYNKNALTPREFAELKTTNQKDWKLSICVGNRTLRWLMDFGLIDFYNHNTFCSQRCVNPTTGLLLRTAVNQRADCSQETSFFSQPTQFEKQYTYCQYINNAANKLPNLFYYPGPGQMGNVMIRVQQSYQRYGPWRGNTIVHPVQPMRRLDERQLVQREEPEWIVEPAQATERSDAVEKPEVRTLLEKFKEKFKETMQTVKEAEKTKTKDKPKKGVKKAAKSEAGEPKVEMPKNSTLASLRVRKRQ